MIILFIYPEEKLKIFIMNVTLYYRVIDTAGMQTLGTLKIEWSH